MSTRWRGNGVDKDESQETELDMRRGMSGLCALLGIAGVRCTGAAIRLARPAVKFAAIASDERQTSRGELSEAELVQGWTDLKFTPQVSVRRQLRGHVHLALHFR
jgi:hypothetical protein